MRAPRRVFLAACAGVLLAQAAPLAAAAELQAVSDDGRWRAHAEGDALVIDDLAAGRPARTLPLRALDGRGPGRVTAILHAPRRRSFVVIVDGLPDRPEMWEVSHDPRAEPIYDGFVHDYKMGEGIAIPGFLNPRRSKLDGALREPLLGPGDAYVLARAPDRPDGRAVLQVWQLDVRRRIGERVLAGEPDLALARSEPCSASLCVHVPLRLPDGNAAVVTIDWRRP